MKLCQSEQCLKNTDSAGSMRGHRPVAAQRSSVVDDGQNLVLAQDQQLLAPNGDLGAGIAAEQDFVAFFDLHLRVRAVVVELARPGGANDALKRLLFGRLGNDNSAGALLVAGNTLDQDTIVKWLDAHWNSFALFRIRNKCCLLEKNASKMASPGYFGRHFTKNKDDGIRGD